MNLQPSTDPANWTPNTLLRRGEVPRELLRSLPDAIAQAPVGSIIIGCQRGGAMWGLCTHMTRKISAELLTEEPGIFQKGAGYRPVSVLLKRDVIIVLDVGVRDEHLPKLRAAAERMKGTPYMISGKGVWYDCVTYQNALQSAVGLPEVADVHPGWNARLPIWAVNRPTNRVLMVGMKALPAGLEHQANGSEFSEPTPITAP